MKIVELEWDPFLQHPLPAGSRSVDHNEESTQMNPKAIHHHGYGRFAADGEMIKLNSKMP